jgi:hypothetical protein
VEIQPQPTSAEINDTHRVETAGNRLAELHETLVELTFDGTEAVPFVVEMTEGTFFSTADKRGNDIAVPVYFKKAFFLDRLPPFFLHQRRKERIRGFQRLKFFFLQRGSAFPHYAARTLANRIVTGEKLRHYLLGNKDVAYLYYGSEFPSHRHSTISSDLPP